MKKPLIVLIILILSAAALFGQNFQRLGYSVVSRGAEDGYTIVTLRDNAGIRFDVYYEGSLSNEQLNQLKEIQTVVASWRNLTISRLQYIMAPDQIEIVIVPASYSYGGRNYIPYLPSGLKFYYTGILEYDFRILVNRMTLRVSGPYFNENQLAEKLKSAVDDPIAYIESHDPEHIARRLTETSDTIEEIKANLSDLDDALEREADSTDRDIVRLKSEAEDFARQYEAEQQELINSLLKEKAALEQQLEEQEEAFSAQLTKMDKQFNETIEELSTDLNKQIADLSAENEKIIENYRLLQLGIIGVTYQGIFSTIKDFNQAAVEKAIALKEANPAFTQEDLIAACKEQDIKLSKKEAHIIFMVYFNEFPAPEAD